ncbi:MAG: Na+/Picotransporter [Rariglobus sp.]|jgi:phosphate:Na+ symporter|nr:Na+/Picotransporter [Rariglobus sp.]
MTELVALFLAGLALFFYGVGGIRTHLNGLGSRRLRQQLSRWARHPVLAGIWGFLFGAITQSSTAVAFILTGLVSNGLMSTAHALPIIAWANLGTAVLVFFVSFNLHLAFLYVLGVSGLALAFNIGAARFRPMVAALFSVGLLFFGLQMMKDAFAPLPGFGWFGDVVAFLQGSALATFILGLLLRLLVQSSSAIAVIAIALAHGGLFSGEQAAMMMYGTGVGVGLSVFLLSSNLQGVPRQLALYQALINSFSGLTLCALYYVEKLTGVPLALGLAESLTGDDSLRLACAFLFLQSTAVGAALIFSRSAAHWMEKLSPPTEEQDLSRPRFLSEDALEDPESALDLVEKEQIRLLGHLTAQLSTIREETAATAIIPAGVLHRGGTAVGTEIQAFIRELAEREVDHNTSRRVLALERRLALIGSLNDTVHAFVETFTRLRSGPALEGSFVDNLAESLNTLILSAIDATHAGDPAEVDLLLRMTADRGDLMERLRRNLLSGPQPLDHQQKSHLFYLTSLFERAVWLLRQLGLAQQSLDPSAAADTKS